MIRPLDSIKQSQLIWRFWHILGIGWDIQSWPWYAQWLLHLYDLSLNVGITICYPLHLIIGVCLASSKDEIFKNLIINVTCLICSLQHCSLRYKLGDIRTIESLLAALDRRVPVEDQGVQSQRIARQARGVVLLFLYAASAANLSAILAVLLSSERRLMYPAWFPFDWQSHLGLYWLALSYQFIGISIQIVQNLINDIYPPLMLCLLGGHVRLLALRVARLGEDLAEIAETLSHGQRREQLVLCIKDHGRIMSIFSLLQNTISAALLAQFLGSGLSLCLVLIYLIFYVDSIGGYIYYSVYWFAMCTEIFPCCYFGSVLIAELDALPYAIFSSNWLSYPRDIRRILITFAELTLRRRTMYAVGLIGIHLDSFFATVKMAYSLFAVVLRIK